MTSIFGPSSNPVSSFQWGYISALLGLALLVLVGHQQLSSAIALNRDDSTVVNLSGRQRMLSQKLTVDALALTFATSPEERGLRRHALQASLSSFRAVHEGLQHGSSELQLDGRNSPAVSGLFVALEPHFVSVTASVDSLLAMNDAAVERGEAVAIVEHLTASTGSFLDIMDQVVFQYDVESRTDMDRLMQKQSALHLALLVLLLSEALLIFRPLVRDIRVIHERLEEATRRLATHKATYTGPREPPAQ